MSAAILGNYFKTKDMMKLFIKDADLLQEVNDMRLEYIERIFGYYQKVLMNINQCHCDNINCDQCKFINMTFDEFLDFRYGVDENKLPDFKYLRDHINNLKYKNVYNNASDYHKLVLTQLKNCSLGNKFITAPAYLGYFKNSIGIIYY